MAFLLYFSCLIATGTALSDSTPVADTLYLDEIIILSTRIREPLRNQPVDVQVLDSVNLERHGASALTELLAAQSSLFIRDNGPGGMASLSQRGLSPGQTRVLWEGFPVNSLSLGQSDLSLLPAGLFSTVEVSPGTPSSAFGGGSLGGTVWLSSTDARRENRLMLEQTAGAFNTWQSRVRTDYHSGNWSASIRGIYRSAANDYGYFNRAARQEERRKNNTGHTGHLMAGIDYRMSSGRIYSRLWTTGRKEEIPGSVLSGTSEAVQSNTAVRWVSGIESAYRNWNFHFSKYLEDDDYHYEDPPSQIDSRIRALRWLAGMDISRPTSGPIVWQGGISGGTERARTANYPGDPRRNHAALRLNPEIHFSEGRFRFTPAIRMDAYTGFGEVFSPSFGANWAVIREQFHLRGMVSRDFNPPSFNDLYWMPGGNIHLDPERSYKIEGGIVLHPGQRVPALEQVYLTGYRIWLNNGIYWFPGHNGIWSPINIEVVNARGMEARTESNYERGRVRIQLTLATDWRISQLGSARFPGDQGTGRQLRYVPEWSHRSHLDIRLSSISLNLNWKWTGRRYITSDHSSSIDPFQVVNAFITINRQLGGVNGTFRIAFRNLLNESYEIIQWYPMPGRHVEFSLSLKLPY